MFFDWIYFMYSLLEAERDVTFGLRLFFVMTLYLMVGWR